MIPADCKHITVVADGLVIGVLRGTAKKELKRLDRLAGVEKRPATMAEIKKHLPEDLRKIEQQGQK